MGVRSRRPAIRALFLLASVFLVFSTLSRAEDSPSAEPPATCPTGELRDEFGECQKACRDPYAGGLSFTSGEQIPLRICFAGGVSISGQPEPNRPACWHYLGTKKGEGWQGNGAKYVDYSIYTNPGDMCLEPGKKECDKLGCEKVEGSVSPGNFTSTGAVAPQFGGQIMSYVPEAPYANGMDQYGTPGGTVASEPAAPEYCRQQGWSDLQLCNQSSQDVWYLQPSGTRPQQANDKSATYLRAPTDVNCLTFTATDPYGNKTSGAASGTCNGPFYVPYNPSNHSWKCSTAKGMEYAGPLREGYNAAASSPSKVCLLAYKEGVLRPIAGSQPHPEFSGPAKWYHMEEFVACEYELSKPSGAAGYKYKGTGASCSVVGAVGSSGGATEGNTKYIPGWDDVACLNGVPDPSVWGAKCTGQKVVNGEVINDHYFGGRVGPYLRFANGQVEVVQDLTGVYPTPGGYSNNSTILGGNPSVGTVNNSTGGTPGGGTVSVPALELSTEMPSQQFEPWYTPEYPDGPVGVWNTRSDALQNTAIVQWVKGFELTGGASFNPSWTLDFSQMGFGAFEVSIPGEIMLVLRYLVLISAAFSVRKIIFGG